jgi:hypothetical protein
MYKQEILKIAPNVLKRFEYGIDTFYLLNTNNNEIWTCNFAAGLFLSMLDEKKNIQTIIMDLEPQLEKFSSEELYQSLVPIIEELLEKRFILKVDEN